MPCGKLRRSSPPGTRSAAVMASGTGFPVSWTRSTRASARPALSAAESATVIDQGIAVPGRTLDWWRGDDRRKTAVLAAVRSAPSAVSIRARQAMGIRWLMDDLLESGFSAREDLRRRILRELALFSLPPFA